MPFFEEQKRRDKEAWRRIRWQTAWLVNISGKMVKRELKETELGIKFPEEIIRIDPEERKRQALETALYHAKMAPRQIKRGKGGKPRIYGEN